MPGIIWLASYPKSGNTWLRAFLANFMRNPDKPIPINDLPNHVLGDNFLIHYEQFSGKTADELTEEDIFRLRPKIHAWFATAFGHDVFVKTHNAITRVNDQPVITPSATAGAIYVVRNPLDVAVSYAHHYQVSYDRAAEALCTKNFMLPAHAGQAVQYLGDWSSHVRSWTQAPGLTCHVMRYEDMVEKPQKTFSKLIRFIGLPREDDRVRKAIRFSSFGELARQESKDGFVEARPDGSSRFFRQGKKGGWRENLAQEQVDRIVDAHGDLMGEMGYLRAGRPIAA